MATYTAHAPARRLARHRRTRPRGSAVAGRHRSGDAAKPMAGDEHVQRDGDVGRDRRVVDAQQIEAGGRLPITAPAMLPP